MRCSRKAIGVVAAVSAALATATTPAFGTAPSSGTGGANYVALGDSYSSGTGTGDYFDDSGDCLRGPKAYPQLWADAHHVADFAFDACSGATTEDLEAEQLDSLNRNTTLVTVSIGGNDVGFAGAIRSCLLGGHDRCDEAVGEGESEARGQLPAKLDAAYAAIASAAPNAKVVVVGYPRISEPGDCGIPGFDEQKRRRINHGSDVLAGVLSERAAAAGFTFADARGAFDGHGVCADDEWINGPSNPLRESFHPNADGHANGYLPAINAATG